MHIEQLIARFIPKIGLGAFAGLIALGISVLGSLLGMFSRADLRIAERQAAFASKPASGQTVIVGIDQNTLIHFGGGEIQRQHYAKVLDNLDSAGAQRIYIDKTAALPSSSEQDAALERSLQALGPTRVAMPVLTLKGDRDDQGEYAPVKLEPLDRFARHVTLTSSDIQFDPDGCVRVLGRTAFDETALEPTVAAWLAVGAQAQPALLNVDFKIDSDSIPVFSFLDVVNGDATALQAVKGKNVIIGVVAERVMQTVSVPRYGTLERAPFLALAAETAAMGSQPTTAPMWFVVLCTAACVLPLGLCLTRLGMFTGGGLTLLMLSLLMYLGVDLQRQANLILPTLLPFSAILLTYAGSLVATHPAFAQTRQAAISLVGKVDFGLARLFHSGVDSIVTFSPDGHILTVNETAEKLFGIKSEEVIGKPLSCILPGTADALIQAASGHQPGRLEATVAGQAGAHHHVDLAFNAMPSEKGWIGYASLRDISAIKAREDELQRQATHDAMTGLPNRRAFERHLDATLRFASETGRPFAVFLLDLNKFKQVNDTLGHHIGDALLIEVANRLKQVVRSSDFVARLGGDEFAAVIAPPTTCENAESIAQHMVAAIASLTELEGHAIETGTSVGVAYYPEHTTRAEELIRMADEAMYEAKRQKLGFSVAASEPTPA